MNAEQFNDHLSKSPIISNIQSDIRELRLDMDERFNKVDQRFDKMDQRFDKMDQRFDKMDQRFDRMEERINFMQILIENFTKEVHIYFEAYAPLVSCIKPKVNEHEERIEHVELRTDVLESVTKSHAAKLSLQ